RQVLLSEYLEKDIENFGVVKLTDKGREFIEKPHSIELTKDHNFEQEVKEDAEKEETQAAAGHDEVLFDLLKNLRKKLAKEKALPPYVLFQDPSLKEMATVYPTTKDELAHIAGVGMGKVQKFGKPFLDMIGKYVEENDIVTAADVVVKTTVNKSKIKIYIIQQIDKKVDLEEIAASKDLTMQELIEEIEHICYSGTKLNLNYYINSVLDEERQDEIYDYFMNASTDNIAVALKELGTDDYTEEDLRLMRIKFLSEYAN
ncbi:MAG TPA: HRDC domain-containing protein, partial [Pontibacter sp.]